VETALSRQPSRTISFDLNLDSSSDARGIPPYFLSEGDEKLWNEGMATALEAAVGAPSSNPFDPANRGHEDLYSDDEGEGHREPVYASSLRRKPAKGLESSYDMTSKEHESPYEMASGGTASENPYSLASASAHPPIDENPYGLASNIPRAAGLMGDGSEEFDAVNAAAVPSGARHPLYATGSAFEYEERDSDGPATDLSSLDDSPRRTHEEDPVLEMSTIQLVNRSP
jgi:hypothetical protein